jgi:hypothetical protein
MARFFLFFFLVNTIVATSQDCSKIFISEYVEGWANNKALEIYNPTSTPVDLSQYFIARYSNGSTTATVANSVQLSGTIAPHDVYVAVLDKRDPNGIGQETPIWDSLNVRADGFYCPSYSTSAAFYWNGNDALLLAKGTLPADPSVTINPTNVPNFAIIDVFGKIGENPANNTGSSAGNDGAWSTQFPYSTGAGVLVTKDHSMLRKASIKKGVTLPVSFFDPLLEWDTIPAVTYLFDVNGDTLKDVNGNSIIFGNWFSLGEHSCDCNPLPCTIDLSISPTINTQNLGGNVIMTATSSNQNSIYLWQSDFGQGFQTLNNFGNYSGVNTNSLSISNVQLANHNQPFRVISLAGNCADTSNVSLIQITDTCITNLTIYDTITTNITIYDTLVSNVYDTILVTINDTLFTTVTDTLIINTTLSLPAPNNENTILIYPNPASDFLTIDNGNFSAMAGYSIKITNNAGQQVFQNVINQAQFNIDLSTWSGNGLYFVHFIDPQNNIVTIRKIILQ